MDKKIRKWKFEARHIGDDWVPMGTLEGDKEYQSEDDEVWVDGCWIQNEALARKIALNMEAAFNKGFEEATPMHLRFAESILNKSGTAIDIRID